MRARFFSASRRAAPESFGAVAVVAVVVVEAFAAQQNDLNAKRESLELEWLEISDLLG
jgi:hypothetical protein